MLIWWRCCTRKEFWCLAVRRVFVAAVRRVRFSSNNTKMSLKMENYKGLQGAACLNFDVQSHASPDRLGASTAQRGRIWRGNAKNTINEHVHSFVDVLVEEERGLRVPERGEAEVSEESQKSFFAGLSGA